MELKKLRYFLCIAERENITQAASDLHITQPHLTRQLHALEKELGVPLFLREKKRLIITEEGIYLKQQVRQLFALLEKTEEHVRLLHAGLTGKLYLGAIETVGPLYVPQWLRRFRQDYPKVTYQLWTANSRDVLERLDEGLLDVALVRGPLANKSRYGILPLFTEGWICLFPDDASAPGPDGTAVTLADLAEKDLIVSAQRAKQIRHLFREEQLEARIVCEFSPLMNGIVLAEQGLGIAILPASAAASLNGHKVVVRPLSLPEMSQVCLVWRSDIKQTEVARRFLDMIRANILQKERSDSQ